MPFTPQPSFTTRPTLRGTFGMAASTHYLATATAQSVLERGGNAVDAAVAAGFVLHVVEPHLNGPGGDLTGLFAMADAAPRVLMGQGPAPAAATIERYRDVEGLSEVPGAGALAAAVPGAVDAWLHLLAAHGTWQLADVLAYAIGYAEQGHPVVAGVVVTIERVRALFAEHWPTSAELWLDAAGNAPAVGDIVTNPAYAAVLRRLLAAGDCAGNDTGADATREACIAAARLEWKTGLVAEAIGRFATTPHLHSDGRTHPGVITAADLAAFDASEEEPVALDFRGFTVAKTGPWGQGPVLLQTLAILNAYAAASGSDDCLDPSTALGIHVQTEALKLALADRDAWYGDPAATGAAEVPLATLLSPEYAAQRAALIGERASAELRPGRPDGREPIDLAALGRTADADAAPDDGLDGTSDLDDIAPGDVADLGAADAARGASGEPTVDRHGQTRGDTCHLDVVDRWGNLVTITPSGGWLQSSPTIPELGFCLGTRLQMAWLDPAVPSALLPGARPRTTLSATLVLDASGRPLFGLGTPGGDQQDQWQLPYLLRVLIGGWSPQAAIDAPAFHTTSHLSSFWPRVWEPAGLVIEGRVDASAQAELAARGHALTVAGEWTLGRLSAAGFGPADARTGLGEADVREGSAHEGSAREVWAAANPRGAQGYAAGR